MDADKDLKALAEELGLSIEALSDEGKDLELPEQKSEDNKKSRKTTKAEKEPKLPKEKKEKTLKETVVIDKNAKALEIEGIPANYQARPIEFADDGTPRELKVNWSAERQEQFRETNGRVRLKVIRSNPPKKGGDTLEVVVEKKDGTTQQIIETNNRSRGVKRAKTWAVLLNLAFDPDKDVEVEIREEKVI